MVKMVLDWHRHGILQRTALYNVQDNEDKGKDNEAKGILKHCIVAADGKVRARRDGTNEVFDHCYRKYALNSGVVVPTG